MHIDARLRLDDPERGAATSKPYIEAGHGRIETRTESVPTAIGWLRETHQWPGPKAVGTVVRIRETATKTTTETAYHLLSSPLPPERLNDVARDHWGAENRSHWRLDVVMNEDQDRTRLGNGPENRAIPRHMALNAMQKDGSKGSLRGPFKQPGWNEVFLPKLLAQF